MIIKLSPCVTVNSTDGLSVKKSADVLTINGERFDFRQVAEGAILPASAVNCESLVSDVTRINGVLVLTLMLPCGPDSSAAARFPADIINPPDGSVSLPV